MIAYLKCMKERGMQIGFQSLSMQTLLAFSYANCSSLEKCLLDLSG